MAAGALRPIIWPFWSAPWTGGVSRETTARRSLSCAARARPSPFRSGPKAHRSGTLSSPPTLPGEAHAWDTSPTTGKCRPLVAAMAQGRARPLSSPRPDRRSMSLLFAAIGPVITARAEVTFGLYDAVGSATPHPVLVGGVIWTVAAGIDRGITWAFVGGLVLDSLLGRPLGVSPFSLLIAVGGAALIAQPFPRLRLIAPIVAVPVLSLVSSVVLLGLTAAVQQTPVVADPLTLLTPGALYDGLLGLFIGPLAVVVHDRRAATERVDW